jgi:hypothetical protein
MDPRGQTRLVVSVPVKFLSRIHLGLIAAMAPPLGVLYRQVVDRENPKPQGAPPRDFVGLELAAPRVIDAVTRCSELIHHDARCELWVRGAMGEQLVIDPDGLIYLYPDDPSFEDVLLGEGLSPDVEETIVDRDYAKHWFHSENDPVELHFIDTLKLTEVPHRAG